MSTGQELQRACLCLNVTFTIIPDDVLSSSELEVARSLFAEAVPKLLVVGRLTSIDVKHPTLTSRSEQHGWTLHSCDCCMMAVFVADQASRAAVDGSCKRESEFAAVMGSANFSKTFGIAIPHKSAGAAAWHSIDDVSGCPQEMLALATEKISNEKFAVDQRIKAYAYQQREQFEAFRQRTLVELEALSAAAVKSSEEKPTVSSLPFIRAGSPKSRTSPFHLTPPRASPTPPLISSARSHSLILDRRPSINSSYPSRDSVSGLDSPQPTDLSEIPAGDDSIFEFEEDVATGPKGYYLSANSFQDWGQQDEDDEELMSSAVETTRIPPIGGRSEGFSIASSLPISIPQSFKFTPHGGNSVTNRGFMAGSSSNSSSSSSNAEMKTGSGSEARRGSLIMGGNNSTMAGRLQSRPEEEDEDERIVNMLLPPHTHTAEGFRTRKGSEKDAEEQFEHAVRFQSLSLKTRTYL